MLENVFATPIFSDILSTEEIESINTELDNVINYADSKGNPWNDNVITNFEYDKDNNFYIKTPELNEAFSKRIIEYLKRCGVQQSYDIRVLESWYNIYDKGSNQDWHEHNGIGNIHISGVYYYKVPKNSKDIIEFRNPAPLVRALKFPANMSSNYHETINFVPEQGVLLLFPSYLEHRVPIIKEQGTRVTVAYNFRIEEDDSSNR